MKRVLIVAYYFPPIVASGSVRPSAFCRYLPEFDWEPYVLTTDAAALDPPLPEDQSLCEGLASSLRIVRVAHANPNQWLLRMRDQLCGLWGDRRSSKPGESFNPGGAEPSVKPRSAVRNGVDQVLEGMLIFPDPQKFWKGPALRQCERIVHEIRPDVIVATGGPWTSLMIGRILSERHGIPLVADFRDPWATNPYLTYSSPRWQRRAQAMEQEVCERASAIIANTEELAASFRTRYPEMADRVVAITNGFDGSLLRRSAGAVEVGSSNRLELAHFGTVYAKRSPQPLFEALLRLVTDQPELAHQVVVRFTGEWEIKNPVCNRLACELEEKGVLQRAGRIDRAECLSRMAESQVLLILQEGTPLQIPAKIYEYIAMRRPLLIIGGEGATANLVHRHNLGICCLNDAKAIEDLLRQVLTGHCTLEVPNEAQTMQFEYRFLTARLADLLNHTLSNSKAVRSHTNDFSKAVSCPARMRGVLLMAWPPDCFESQAGADSTRMGEGPC